ncbi:MAG: hypothetical protein AAF389_01585 [Gemmatimonadota bacterium]
MIDSPSSVTRWLVLRRWAPTLLLCAAMGACGSVDEPADAEPEPESTEVDPQVTFWDNLQSMCGQAYEGRLVESVPPDPSFEGQRMVMHVRSCDVAEIRIPFFVGEDRSRTWVLTPTSVGLRLKHDHRHEDGSEDEVTQYGGDTEGRGTGESQDFHADDFTAELVPAAATNIWTIELVPGVSFAYALRREGSDRRFRAEFDLSQPIDTPLPPWGAEEPE